MTAFAGGRGNTLIRRIRKIIDDLRWHGRHGDILAYLRAWPSHPVREARWRYFRRGPQRELTLQTLNGLLTFDVKADTGVGRDLYVQRSYEAELMQRAVACLRREGCFMDPEKDVLVDVGANIGAICIAMLRLFHFRRALAFEPAPSTYDRLVRNLRQNQLEDRVVHFPCALSSVRGELDLELADGDSGDNRIRCTEAPGLMREERRRTAKVPVRTLDDVLAQQPDTIVDSIGLVWMDVQGHEGYVLEGSRQLFARGIPLVCEFWPYGIERSGMSRGRFEEIISEYFTHFLILSRRAQERLPTSQFTDLFDTYREPMRYCQVALFRRG